MRRNSCRPAPPSWEHGRGNRPHIAIFQHMDMARRSIAVANGDCAKRANLGGLDLP